MSAEATTVERPRLRRRYDEEIRARLKGELGLQNIMQVPRLEKIVLKCLERDPKRSWASWRTSPRGA